MSQKTLILIFFVLFTASTAFLFWRSDRELDPNLNKIWWTLSFISPNDSENLDFAVENYGSARSFRYEITSGTNSLKQESFDMAPGERRIVMVSIVASMDARTMITVTSETEKKEIYR